MIHLKQLMFIAFFLPITAHGQDFGWQRDYPYGYNYGFEYTRTDTIQGGFLFSTRAINRMPCLVKVDLVGQVVWTHTDTLTYMSGVSSLIGTRDSGTLISVAVNGTQIRKLDKFGRIQWRKTVHSDPTTGVQCLLETRDGFLATYQSGGANIAFEKMDKRGNTIWRMNRYELGRSAGRITELSTGDYIFTVCQGYSNSGRTTLHQVSPSGTLISSLNLHLDLATWERTRILLERNNQIYHISDSILERLNIDVLQVTHSIRLPIGGTQICIRRKGGFWGFSTQNGIKQLMQFDDNMQLIRQTPIAFGHRMHIRNMQELSDNRLLLNGLNALIPNSNAIILTVVDTNGQPNTNKIQGLLKSNCNVQHRSWMVTASRVSDGATFSGVTDEKSRFEIYVDTGRFVVKAEPKNALLASDSVSLMFPIYNQIQDTLIPIRCMALCPSLSVQMSAARLRRCFESTYTVSYCNNGTATAVNAYVEVQFDSLLRYVSATRPFSSRVGPKFRFNLGDLAPDSCHSFEIKVISACGDSTRLGQALCNQIRIYPDTICAPPANWTGAHLQIVGACERDSVLFTVMNRGSVLSNTIQPVLFENATARQTNPILLSANSQKTYRFPANGNTWRMSVPQAANHPYNNQPIAVISGCRSQPNMVISNGFVTTLPLDTRNPVFKTVCTELTGSFDPNDKMSIPSGYGPTNAIEANSDIEYMIRFQNTGTDTAFTVVIRDTLSPFLDASSVRVLSASHPYEWTVLKNKSLQVRFLNLLLVDSFHNEPKSHGFVKFSIRQQPNLRIGSKIYNRAGIYFDFNEPVLTNRTLLTVGQPLLLGTSDASSQVRMRMLCYPNPTTEQAFLELLDAPDDASVRQFQLLDGLGRVLRVASFQGNRLEWTRDGLNSGMYWFRVEQNGQLLGIGRIVIQ